MNFNILAAATPAQLLALYADILTELRQRGVTRSNNNPAADYAESLVAKAFDLDLATNSTAGYDAISKDGTTRYQVKGRRPTKMNPSRQLGAIRDLSAGHFDYLAAILFAEDFSIGKACLIPAAVVEREAKYIAHTNSWMLHLRDGLWAQEGVLDITDAVRAAALDEAHQENTSPVPADAPEAAAASAPTIPVAAETTGVPSLAEPKVT